MGLPIRGTITWNRNLAFFVTNDHDSGKRIRRGLQSWGRLFPSLLVINLVLESKNLWVERLFVGRTIFAESHYLIVRCVYVPSPINKCLFHSILIAGSFVQPDLILCEGQGIQCCCHFLSNPFLHFGPPLTESRKLISIFQLLQEAKCIWCFGLWLHWRRIIVCRGIVC